MAYVHAPGTAGCLPDLHCYSHDVDERALGWLVCFECRHVYDSAGELRAKYRKGLRAVYWADFKRAGWRSRTMEGLIVGETFRVDGKWRTLGHLLFRVPFVRARDIHFCPECLHDF